MTNKVRNLLLCTALTFTELLFSTAATAQSYTISPELRGKIDSHPHVRQIADWGSRAEWSPDSKHLIFISKQFGDAFELDVTSGKTRPLTFHYSHAGVIRAYYLANGDILLAAPRTHTPGRDGYERIFGSELWVLKADLSGPPVALGVPNMEGVAVSQNGMRIAWGKPPSGGDASPPKEASRDMANTANQLWTADIVYDGAVPKLANSRMVLDCDDKNGPLAKIAAKSERRCWMIEAQNFVPPNDKLITFSLMTAPIVQTDPSNLSTIEINPYLLNLETGQISELKKDPKAYAEVEGVFPDGKSSLIEYYDRRDSRSAVNVIDLWSISLDGRAKLKQVTHYNSIDPQLKSNQGVISPDGRWMAFGVSTAEIEEKVPGQGIGLFLMDLRAAGF